MFSIDEFILQELRMARKPRHPSMQRLLDFVKDQDVVGPSALASAMGETEQVITNWSARGISSAGAVTAEKKFGCAAVWVLEGVNPPNTSTLQKGWSIDHMFSQLPDNPILRAKVHHAAMAPILAALSGIDLPNGAPDQPATPKRSAERHQ